MQFTNVIARDAEKKRGRRASRFVVFAGVPDQGQECFLNDVRCGLWASAHVHGVPVESALMPAIELQERVLIARGETPQKIDITCFD
jgi:hypothetical protein